MTAMVDINDWTRENWTITLAEMFDWCIENCTGQIEIDNNNRSHWYFEKDEDAVLFVLRWK